MLGPLGEGGAGAASEPEARVAGPQLTARELEVLVALSRGRDAGQIAREMSVSPGTAKAHRMRLFRKLGVHDEAAAVAVGFRLGLLR